MNAAIELFKGVDFNRQDFTLKWSEFDFHSCSDRHNFLLQLMEAKRAALKHGYTIEETRSHDMIESIRFFRKPVPS